MAPPPSSYAAPVSEPAAVRDPTLGAALSWLLDAAHLAPPDAVPALVDVAARMIGADDSEIYLADYSQRTLMPVARPGQVLEPIPIDGSLAGRVFASERVSPSANGDHRLTVPLVDGSDRLGVLVVSFGEPADEHEHRVVGLASLLASLVTNKAAYGDVFHCARRRKDMSLAAELQWQSLPPLTFRTPDVVVAGQVEPAYAVGGDLFDYALNGDLLHLAVFDAMGHGLGSSVLAGVVIGAYRHSRRLDQSLTETAEAIDRAVADQFGSERFATAHLSSLEVDTGILRWLCAGHPQPLLLRRDRVVKTLGSPPRLPLGLGGIAEDVGGIVVEEQLEPGDRVLMFSDGLVEARAKGGDEFGLDRLADFLQRESASGQGPAELMRRLVHSVLEYHGDKLQDDATVLMVEWRP
ncbi:PP2C family protein-serine/threonine phosphatase [soil metagenome]